MSARRATVALLLAVLLAAPCSPHGRPPPTTAAAVSTAATRCARRSPTRTSTSSWPTASPTATPPTTPAAWAPTRWSPASTRPSRLLQRRRPQGPAARRSTTSAASAPRRSGSRRASRTRRCSSRTGRPPATTATGSPTSRRSTRTSGTNADLRALVDDAHGRGMKVYFDIITNHTADVIGYEERRPPGLRHQGRRRPTGRRPGGRSTTATTPARPTSRALDPATSFPYVPMLDPAEENLKVPAWLNDVTLYHNRGDTTFVGENSLLRRLLRPRRPVHREPPRRRGHDRRLQDVDPRLRRRRLPHRHDEARQRRVLAGVRSGVLRLRARARASASSSCSARSSTPRRTSRRTSRPATGCRRCSTSRSRTRPATSRRAAPTRDASTTFFAADDWYTDADSNVYQLPTFLGNHDMGRIGWFVQTDNPGAGDAEWMARDRLAHELMYFSRGNPVIYYGDEQGFTGSGGDQVARQTMFASQVPRLPRRRPARHRRDPRAGQLRAVAPALPVDQRPRRAHPRPTRRCATVRSSTGSRPAARRLRVLPDRPQGPARVRGRAEQRRGGADRRHPDLRRGRQGFTKRVRRRGRATRGRRPTGR